MAIAPPPPGTDFLYGSAHQGLQEQWKWIDALDTKAGVLVAADAVIAGLLFRGDSLLWVAPTWLSVTMTCFLLVSLLLALLSFATRRYETGPDVEDLLSVGHLSRPELEWFVVPGLLYAIEVNESKIAQKSNFLFYAGLGLLVTVGLVGAYFVNALIP